MPLLSDPDSPTKNELDELERQLFKQDVFSPFREPHASKEPKRSFENASMEDEPIALGQIYSPLAFLDARDPPSAKKKRIRPDNFKVEGPLTPELPMTAFPKSVRFNEIIEEFVPAASRNNTPRFEEDPFFQDAFGDAAERANQKLEQEKLIAADTIGRVVEPLMDFKRPNPPWQDFEEQRDHISVMSLQLSLIQDVVNMEPPKWPIVKFNQKLKHAPFHSNLARVSLEESFPMEDDTKVRILMGEKEKVINSSDLTWKPPSLRILRDHDDDDDDIELGVFQKVHPQDISILARKRKLEIEEAASIRHKASKALSSLGGNETVQARTSNLNPHDFMTAGKEMRFDTSHKTQTGLLGGTFSVMNSLDNFLEIRGAKKAKLSDTSHFKVKAPQDNHGWEQDVLKPPSPQQAMQLPVRKPPFARAEHLPAPPAQASSDKISIIASSTLFKHKTLIKYLESSMPSIQFIERDWHAHDTTIWMPGSVARSPIKSSLADEADVIISPSTGVVITTLQKIKQKLLPGQKGKPAIRDRVERVSLRYEKLFIFITEGRSDETTMGLDENDCLAFSDFVSFTMSLDTTITVEFVGGGEGTLAKWLTSAIMQQGRAQQWDLLDEETHWELFLRLAGMNAFAAQVIIQELKAPEGVNPDSPTKAGQFGLTSFVEMGREQRISKFSRFCGTRVLERVSAIDAKWE